MNIYVQFKNNLPSRSSINAPENTDISRSSVGETPLKADSHYPSSWRPHLSILQWLSPRYSSTQRECQPCKAHWKQFQRARHLLESTRGLARISGSGDGNCRRRTAKHQKVGALAARATRGGPLQEEQVTKWPRSSCWNLAIFLVSGSHPAARQARTLHFVRGDALNAHTEQETGLCRRLFIVPWHALVKRVTRYFIGRAARRNE